MTTSRGLLHECKISRNLRESSFEALHNSSVPVSADIHNCHTGPPASVCSGLLAADDKKSENDIIVY